MSDKSKDIELNEKQKAFCKYYVSREFFANGVEAYGEAYGLDLSQPKEYNVARTGAWRLLTKADICLYINELLDLSGLNDAFVDKQLLFTITQNADFGSKVAAIKEYNKLKSRIVEKAELKHSGIFDVTLNLK
jgi:hypothetical protein